MHMVVSTIYFSNAEHLDEPKVAKMLTDEIFAYVIRVWSTLFTLFIVT